ncbi:unnamed protein product [Gordionus sp. m RMFG-2023]
MIANYYIGLFTIKISLPLGEFSRFNVNWINVIIVADRIVAIRRPLFYKRMTTKQNILAMTSLSTFINFLFSLPYIYKADLFKINQEIFVREGRVQPNISSYNVTTYYAKAVNESWMYPYDSFLLFFMYVTPVVLTIVGNFELYGAIWKMKKNKITPQTELSGNDKYMKNNENRNILSNLTLNSVTTSQFQVQNEPRCLEKSNHLLEINQKMVSSSYSNKLIKIIHNNISNYPSSTINVLIQSHLKSNNMKVEIQQRHSNNNKYCKLIIAQNVSLIVSNLPFVIYVLITKNTLAVKLVKPSDRGLHLMLLTLRYLYPFLEVYINIFFDPDIKNIIKLIYRA